MLGHKKNLLLNVNSNFYKLPSQTNEFSQNYIHTGRSSNWFSAKTANDKYRFFGKKQETDAGKNDCCCNAAGSSPIAVNANLWRGNLHFLLN